ncbi:BQ5605_C054g12621 [Microbotryum silenes-dioicae]|uniref:ATP-dependent DNA helicase n=2 Tax=Microbotryum silenes-dioicae TaxID=796604 RepID=A0A2X0MS91_9BASI|nr:BQ5605_C054g12621 [Microbotryum silenes-dioicae]
MQTVLRVYHVDVKERFSIFLPPALHTLPIAPHPIATSSLRHPKRSSWKLCNEYGTSFLKKLCSMQYRSRSKSSTARFGGVTVAMAGDTKQCLPVVLKSSPIQIVDACIMNADFWVEVEVLLDFVRLRIRVIGTLNKNRSVNCGSPSRGRSSTARFGGVTVVLTAFRSGPTQFFAEPCLYRINIDESFYFQKI